MGNLRVVTLHGEFDISQEARVESELDRIEPCGANATTILDLADVSHLDTTFINALLRARKRLDETQPGHQIVLVAPKTNLIWRLSEINALPSVFPLYENAALALRSGFAVVPKSASNRSEERTQAWPSFMIEVLKPQAPSEEYDA